MKHDLRLVRGARTRRTEQLDLARGKFGLPTGRLASEGRPWQRRAPAPVSAPSARFLQIDQCFLRFPAACGACKGGRFQRRQWNMPAAARPFSMVVSTEITPMRHNATRRAAGLLHHAPSPVWRRPGINPEDSNRRCPMALPIQASRFNDSLHFPHLFQLSRRGTFTSSM